MSSPGGGVHRPGFPERLGILYSVESAAAAVQMMESSSEPPDTSIKASTPPLLPRDAARLRRAWLNGKYRGSYTSAGKFHVIVNQDAQQLGLQYRPTYSQIRQLLESIPNHQQFIRPRKVKNFRHVTYEGTEGGGSFIPGAGICFQGDLAQFPISDDNFLYALLLADMWQMYIYVRPLESKSASETLAAIKSIVDTEHLDRFNTLSTDEGEEFKANEAALGHMNIKWIRLSDQPKAFLAEERIRVLKFRLHRNLRQVLDSSWENYLQQVDRCTVYIL